MAIHLGFGVRQMDTDLIGLEWRACNSRDLQMDNSMNSSTKKENHYFFPIEAEWNKNAF